MPVSTGVGVGGAGVSVGAAGGVVGVGIAVVACGRGVAAATDVGAASFPPQPLMRRGSSMKLARKRRRR